MGKRKSSKLIPKYRKPRKRTKNTKKRGGTIDAALIELKRELDLLKFNCLSEIQSQQPIKLEDADPPSSEIDKNYEQLSAEITDIKNKCENYKQLNQLTEDDKKFLNDLISDKNDKNWRLFFITKNSIDDLKSKKIRSLTTEEQKKIKTLMLNLRLKYIEKFNKLISNAGFDANTQENIKKARDILLNSNVSF